MNDIQRFLAHAIQLEKESARRYAELAEAMDTLGNAEVAEFFRQMSHYSRLHQKEAMERGGFHDLPNLAADEYHWPNGSSPEAAWGHVNPGIDVLGAMSLAMHGEQRSHEYYQTIADETADPEVRAMATEFADEEAEHVVQLEVWQANLAKLTAIN
ncbi:Rubrerythrin [Azotobacter beijerinckii]|uniref:Rubrerythrin n=1 Tax=Azotobacter beijerinckii TaxID=170623 RepID=A0A1H7AMG6_9GAMM|nr:ferritin family protein [Azotobacter beijerinckii]SEI53039.1 Rubrerythrin [Azotobacter beijerinckii]SEJ66568.1 Rubrerythrin [Azotobacter beijerinckii]